MIDMVKPEYLVPTHGNLNMLTSMQELWVEMGRKKENCLIIKNGDRIDLS